MAKKNKAKKKQEVTAFEEPAKEVPVATEEVKTSSKVEEKAKSKNKDNKDKKVDKKGKKEKVKEKGKLARKARETTSELKKVTWPTFKDVVKRTGVVLAVVVIFAVILFGIDSLFGFLFELLTRNGQ